MLAAFDDFMFTFQALRRDDFGPIAGFLEDSGSDEEKSASVDRYWDLFSPALEWLLQNIGQCANEDLFFALLQQYKDYCNCR